MKKYTLIFLTLFSNLAYANENSAEVEICKPPEQIIHKNEIQGSPYFLNYRDKDPSTYLTIVIWESDIPKLEINPYTYFQLENVCMRGEVTYYNKNKQIVIKEPSQLFVPKNNKPS